MGKPLRAWPVTGRAFLRARAPQLLAGVFVFSLGAMLFGAVSFACAIPGLADQSPLVAQLAGLQDEAAAPGGPQTGAARDDGASSDVDAYGAEATADRSESETLRPAQSANADDEPEDVAADGDAGGDEAGDEADGEGEEGGEPAGKVPSAAAPAASSRPAPAAPPQGSRAPSEDGSSSAGDASAQEPEPARPEDDPAVAERIAIYGANYSDEEVAVFDERFRMALDDECEKLEQWGERAYAVWDAYQRQYTTDPDQWESPDVYAVRGEFDRDCAEVIDNLLSACPGGQFPPAYAKQADCLSRAYGAIGGVFGDVMESYSKGGDENPHYFYADYFTYDANGNSYYLEQYEIEKAGAWVR